MHFPILIAGAIVTAGLPPNTGSWVTPDDYPRQALQEGRSGGVEYRLTIAPDGKVAACAIDKSSGFTDLDQQTCALLMRRANFRPARDASGIPIFAIYHGASLWWTGDGKPPPQPSDHDMTLPADQLPASIDVPARITIAFQVAADGAVSECGAQSGGRLADKLSKIACEQAKAQPAVGQDGAPVASIQTLRVLFAARP